VNQHVLHKTKQRFIKNYNVDSTRRVNATVISMISNDLKDKNEKFRKLILSYLNGYPEGEGILVAFLILRQSDFKLFKKYPYIYNYEYFVEPPYSHIGKGDLILTSGRKNYLIVEAKYFDNISSGKTASRRRGQHRSDVRKQAKYFGNAFKNQNPFFNVEYTTLTNDSKRNAHFDFYFAFREFQWKKKEEWNQRY